MTGKPSGTSETRPTLNRFRFRPLHPRILLGTASDRYAGWLGQIYTTSRYEGRISRRSNTVGGKTFTEEVLPVESVAEYFEHFPVLEIDYTFYSTLLDKDGQPTKNYRVLQAYARHIGKNDRVVLKVPQVISAQRLRRGKQYVQNETYLDPEIFVKQFYEPANELLGPSLSAMLLEQEYQRKQERPPASEMARALNRFFEAAPKDHRYHVELRTGAYLSQPVFDVLEKHGAGQVLSQWTWLPPLEKQLARASGRIFNSGRQRIIRLMTPLGMRYEDAYAKAHPFDQLVDEMYHPEMVKATVRLLQRAVAEDLETSVLINNRAGGNAPLIAEQIAETFLDA